MLIRSLVVVLVLTGVGCSSSSSPSGAGKALPGDRIPAGAGPDAPKPSGR